MAELLIMTYIGYEIVRKFYLGLLLVLLLYTISTGGCTTQPEQQNNITEEQFKNLLTVQDIERILVPPVELYTKFYDYKKMAESADPEQVANMDSFYGLSFLTEGGMNGLTFSVIDFDSQTSAHGFEKMKSETPGFEDMAIPIGEASAKVDVNTQGIGSIIVFLLGDRTVSFHTATQEGESPVVNLNALEELARIAEERLQSL